MSQQWPVGSNGKKGEDERKNVSDWEFISNGKKFSDYSLKF